MHVQMLIHQLHEIGAIRFGSFTLKSGQISPVYIDLRLTISFPKLLVAISSLMYEKVQKTPFDLVCGVPYTALPFATVLSIQHQVPMILRRKEKKEYGTAKLIEGQFEKGQTCLLLEDVITSGQSLLETIASLEQEGLKVKDLVVLVDREQGAKKILSAKGYQVHCICTLSEIVQELCRSQKITAEMAQSVSTFIQQNICKNG